MMTIGKDNEYINNTGMNILIFLSYTMALILGCASLMNVFPLFCF